MRTIKELLEVLRENKQYFYGGLCCLTCELKNREIITDEEESFIDAYVKTNSPGGAKGFIFRWKYNQWEPRLKWINEQIEQLTQ
jgi:hypothetical protein